MTTQIIVASPFILYLIASTGRTRIMFLYWHPILQLALDAFLLPIWLIPTAGAAVYDCKSICTSCQSPSSEQTGFYAWVGSMTCSCFRAMDGKDPIGGRKAVAINRKTVLRPGRDDPLTKVFAGAQRISLVEWAQWIMM